MLAKHPKYFQYRIMTTVKTQKTYKLSNFEAGDRFEIPSVTETMRNLVVISSNISSTLVEGERRDTISDSWKPFRFPISNDVNAVLVAKGAPKTKDFDNTTEAKPSVSEEPTEARRRGRPAKQSKPLNELGGTKGEFTVKDLVAKNNLKEYDAHNLVRSAIKNGSIKVVREESGGRGKPRKVYSLV